MSTAPRASIAEFLREHPPQDTLHRLFAGSWISHNFGIWIGHPEDNQAWELLGQARAALQRAPAGPERGQKPLGIFRLHRDLPAPSQQHHGDEHEADGVEGEAPGDAQLRDQQSGEQ